MLGKKVGNKAQQKLSKIQLLSEKISATFSSIYYLPDDFGSDFVHGLSLFPWPVKGLVDRPCQKVPHENDGRDQGQNNVSKGHFCDVVP